MSEPRRNSWGPGLSLCRLFLYLSKNLLDFDQIICIYNGMFMDFVLKVFLQLHALSPSEAGCHYCCDAVSRCSLKSKSVRLFRSHTSPKPLPLLHVAVGSLNFHVYETATIPHPQ